MCLSRVYTNEKTEENCVMEEAARVESHENDVEVFTLFGENKSFHGYSVHIVDLMKNFVLIKKNRTEHTHHHDHKNEKDSAAGKLKKLLPYLLAHNRGHAEDIERWALKAEESGYKDAAEELKAAIHLFHEINNHFEKALGTLDR